MFIGHFAPAFAAAAISHRAPKLGLVFIAAQLVDWAFFLFAMFGLEKMRIEKDATVLVPFDLYYMPYTHSLIGSLVWAAAFGAIIWMFTRNQTAAILSAAVVASHWVLDWITHRPDLTIAGGPEAYGLGLWNYPWVAIPLELAITFGAFGWYYNKTRGPIGPSIILLSVMLLFYALNLLGPVPEKADWSLYTVSLFAFGVLTGLAWWVGQNRWHKRARD